MLFIFIYYCLILFLKEEKEDCLIFFRSYFWTFHKKAVTRQQPHVICALIALSQQFLSLCGDLERKFDPKAADYSQGVSLKTLMWGGFSSRFNIVACPGPSGTASIALAQAHTSRRRPHCSLQCCALCPSSLHLFLSVRKGSFWWSIHWHVSVHPADLGRLHSSHPPFAFAFSVSFFIFTRGSLMPSSSLTDRLGHSKKAYQFQVKWQPRSSTPDFQKTPNRDG